MLVDVSILFLDVREIWYVGELVIAKVEVEAEAVGRGHHRHDRALAVDPVVNPAWLAASIPDHE